MRAVVLGAMAAGSVFAAAPASAAIVFVAYSGTASGTDNLGYFGTAGTIFTDAAFTATFQFNTDLGKRTTTALSDSLEANFEQPLLMATFTLGGQTLDFAGADTSHLVVRQTENFTHNVGASVQRVQPVGNMVYHRQLSLGAFFLPAPAAIDVFAHAEGVLGNSHAIFQETLILDLETPEYSSVNSFFDLATTTYDVQVNGAIPEPSAWALMILGFGSAGVALRRRRQLA